MARMPRFAIFVAAALIAAVTAAPAADAQSIFALAKEFPKTDFSKRAIAFKEIFTGGPRRDSIEAIFDPKYVPVGELKGVGDLEPVISVSINGDARAFPLRILIFHEIVNDEIGGVPVLVTFCPLCNSGVVFDRRVEGRTLTFANTGRLRKVNMVIYDQETESWWQQFTGDSIIGTYSGMSLKLLPARIESLTRFADRNPDGRVLVPNDPNARPYGTSGGVGVDDLPIAFARQRYPNTLPEGVNPIERVIVVGDEAWTLERLRGAGKIVSGPLEITWEPGQNSVTDARFISDSRDVGNVVVRRRTDNGLADQPYDVSFAFAFNNFFPDGTLHY